MFSKWTLYYYPGPTPKQWHTGQLRKLATDMSWWNARVYMDIYKDYPMDTVVYAENEKGKRIYPNRFNKILTDIGVMFNG